MLPNLGIIAGDGLLPIEIASSYKKIGGNAIIAFLGDNINNTDLSSFGYEKFKIGQLTLLIDFFRNNHVNDLVFAGSINRPNFKDIKVDKLGYILLSKILKNKLLGDDSILRTIATFFEKQGFKILAADSLLPSGYNNSKLLTKKQPIKSDLLDIDLGIKILTQLASLDVGQSVIVNNRYILGIEGPEGTDNLIDRCFSLRKQKSGGVLIKMKKIGQSDNMDIPVIGINTINKLADKNFFGIAIQKKGVIILQQDLCINIANNRGLFITFI